MVSMETAGPAAHRPLSRGARWLRRLVNPISLITVILPTLLAAVYFGMIASDVYVSESRFVVRSPQRANPSGLGALLQGTGLSRSQDDTYSVHDYVRSRDALALLLKDVDLRKSYSSERVDPINRLPGLMEWDNSFEGLHRHYLRHVGIEYDSVSSISVLRVRSYDPDEARVINERLLQLGERLVNDLNVRIRRDLIASSEVEVVQAEARAKAAAQALAGFRAEGRVYDPDRQTTVQLNIVARMQEELAVAEAQLAQIRQVSPQNPQIPSLTSRVETLRKAVAAESGKVAGGGSYSAKSPAYDRLVLEKSFADRQLAGALAALETARSEAARKQLYLERLVQPNKPDSALEPRRMRAVFTVFLMGLVAWGIAYFVLASIREHAE